MNNRRHTGIDLQNVRTRAYKTNSLLDIVEPEQNIKKKHKKKAYTVVHIRLSKKV